MKIRSLVVFGVLTAATGLAQGGPGDPPSRVARLNLLLGEVSFQPAGIDVWSPATPNYPLTTGDHIYTDTRARAEMHIGPNAIRLDSESNFGFLNLDDRTVQMRFTEGSIEVRLRRLDDNDVYEIDTPQAAISLLRTGDYRVDTDPSRNATMVTVWSGQAEVSANGRAFIVRARQTAYVPEGLDADIRAANPVDDFDHFTADRNLHDDRVPAPLHVSESMVGYQDLDEYGTWNNTPDYGWAWEPRVSADWAPYHRGRWCWVEPWGWTWVDEAPWGFAPFHYGRWANSRGGWLWVPGAVVTHPVYAPALVAFVGGPRFSIALGVGAGGGIGWFPLAPREPYYPAYRVSNTYIRQVNITNVTNVVVVGGRWDHYANQHVPGAAIAVTQQSFVGSRPVRESGRRVAAEQMRESEVLAAGPGVAPRRESVIGVQTNRTVARPSEVVATRPVVTRSAPPPPAVSFQAREQAIRQNGGRPLAPEQMNDLRRQQPGASVNSVPVRVVPARPQSERQPDRIDSRPRNVVRPVAPGPVETQAPQRPEFQRNRPSVDPPSQQERPDFNRQRPNRPDVESRPQAPVRPPEPRPQPEVRRESSPVVREPRPESAAPRREERPAPVREQPRPENKPETKPEGKKDGQDK
jgi:hypothetical protein